MKAGNLTVAITLDDLVENRLAIWVSQRNDLFALVVDLIDEIEWLSNRDNTMSKDDESENLIRLQEFKGRLEVLREKKGETNEPPK